MKVRLWRNDQGAPAFGAGDAGTLHPFEEGDENSIAIAFTKAVNDIIESGEEVEGDAAIEVAAVIKEAGQLAWPAGSSYDALREKLDEALPGYPAGEDKIGKPYHVRDIALDANHALICGWTDGDDEHFVVPFTAHSDGSVVVGDRSQWVEVEQEFVAKAGRMFSARNLDAMQEAHESLGKLIDAGLSAVPKADAEDAGEEETTKATEEDVEEMSYTVQKSDSAMRYTLGPLYAPMRKDAHGEFIEDDTLHKALHEFVRTSADEGRRINLQHGEKGDIQVGEWVETVRWPYEHTISLKSADGTDHEVEMPAGTVYLGVVWDAEYWDAEASAPKGLNGYSLGGRAIKMRDAEDAPELTAMGYKVTKSTDEAGA